jgi:proteic killer suppression protein
MIKSFKHKGLQAFFEMGTQKGINPQHAAKLARILDRLDASRDPRDMNLPGFGLHRLSGDRAGELAVRVSGNWRVTFLFEGEDAVRVDYVDYH